jgi:hypothetical protein
MKRKTIICVVSIIINILFAAGIIGVTCWKYYRKITKPFRGDYYESRVSHFETLHGVSPDAVFLGDSQTDRCEWAELFGMRGIINRGIDGDTTDGVLNRLDELIAMKPRKIFIMIGGADFIIGRTIPRIEENYKKIVARIRSGSPKTEIYIQSILPTDQKKVPVPSGLIPGLNARLMTLADNDHVFYLDIYSIMADVSGSLNPAYSIDGVHLNGRGYLKWREAIMPYLHHRR